MQSSWPAGGEAGLRQARERPPDLILLDLMMPGMSGLEVLARLGELTPDAPVIIVTANPTSDNAITALRLAIRNQGLIRQLDAKIQELLAILAEYSKESERLSRLHSQA